ncbi:MAG: glycerol-3-phosphate dehydrogenase/oxidase [Herpetosiphon sp.]
MSRSDMLARVRAEEQWDIVVIGGGATGLGTALDAAARGYKTLLLEAHDFAKGTSSRSTKLVHGGVRYLAQGNVKLVLNALHERGLLHRNAPHLAHPLAFVVPAYSWLSAGWYGIGLRIYDLLAGKLGIGSSRFIGFGEAIKRAPTLERKGLLGGVLYYDGQFDDARLAITLLLTILDHGGAALNYMPITGLLKERGRVAGVLTRDSETGEEYTIKARAVVNATGVYADAIRHLDDPTAPAMLAPSQGVHLVLPRSFLPGDDAIMVPRTDDGRVLFIIPWHDRAIVGTTDTPVDHAPMEPKPWDEEIQFLLSHAARYLNVDPERSDVLSVYVGLRPLVKSGHGSRTAALSRDHVLIESPTGLITITGGKWTTYRHMGQDTVDKAGTVAGLPKRPCVTEDLHLHGWQAESTSDPLGVYGSDAPAVRRVLNEQPGWNQPLHPRLPYCRGEVVWAARHEQARTVEDVLSRRTRSLLLDARASREAAADVAALLASELGFDESWQCAQIAAYDLLADGYILKDRTP